MSADRNLLFGVLAMQLDFITRDQLIAGLQTWVNDKGKTLAEILQAAGALSAPQRQALEPLVAMHIQQHGNDPQQSLASISSADRLRRELDEIQDGDVQQSLVSLGKARPLVEPADPNATLDETLSIGIHTSAGTRFRILRPHDRGGLGQVYVARDTELGREVALKEIRSDKDEPESRARFTREAEITGGLEHPGIVPVYGLGAYPDGRPFYAMRFIRGKSLQDAIKAYHARENTNPTEQNLELRRLMQRFIDVCEAIDYAHSRGVLHRDLKPGNIMLGRYGETLVVDWGLAKAAGRVSNPSAGLPETAELAPLPEPALVPSSNDSSDATQLGSALGTIAYMSPEQANGRWDLLGPASDVFSLGATLFHLLTSRPPYTGPQAEAYAAAQSGEYPRPRTLMRNIPAPLEAICLKALAVRPADRYSTAQDFAQDLERYLADEPIAALPDTLVTRANRWTRHHRHWMQASSIALLLVAITAIGAYFYQRETAIENQKLAHDANTKKEALQASLARSHFAHGVAEIAVGRLDDGVLDLQRAVSVARHGDPLRASYEQVLLDRATREGVAIGLPLLHEGPVGAVAFNPAGDRVLTGAVGTSRLWDARTGVPMGKPLRHGDREVAVAFSPKGDRFVTVSDDTSQIWDALNGEPLGELLRHDDSVTAVVFNPQGDLVLTGSLDKTARLWDARTGIPFGVHIQHGGKVLAVAFSPQGDRVVTGSDDCTARLWNAGTGAPIGAPMRHNGSVDVVSFSPKGDLILTGSSDQTARLWDAGTGGAVGEPMRHDHMVIAAAFSPQGDRVVTGSNDDTARLWDALTGAPIGKPLQHGNRVAAVAFSPGGDRVLTGSDDSTARLWDSRTGARVGEPMRHNNAVRAVAFSPQGDRVLTGSDDWTARLWDALTGAPIGKPLEQQSKLVAVAFSPQDHVLTLSWDEPARLWDALTGRIVGETLRDNDGLLHAVAFSPSGDRILTGSEDRTARVWNARTGAPIGKPLQHEHRVVAVAFSPLGDRLLTGSHDKTARVWDATTGAAVIEPLRHQDLVNDVAFSPQGDRIVTGCDDWTARLWDARTGAPIGKPLEVGSRVLAVAFSPQGDRLLTGSVDKTARLWDAQTGVPVGEPLRHEGLVNDVAFSPEGDRVVTGSDDKTARLWDARTGAPLRTPLRHESRVVAVAFSRLGDRVLTGSSDDTARLWDVTVQTPQDVAAFAVLVSGNDMDSEGTAKRLSSPESKDAYERFYVAEAEWIAAIAKRSQERQLLHLTQRLREGLNSSELFSTYQSARWLAAEELPKLDAKSLKSPAVQVLVAWFRDGKLDQVAGALTESAEVPEAVAGKVLQALREAIPSLYWETDERLGRLGKELEKRAAEAGPTK